MLVQQGSNIRVLTSDDHDLSRLVGICPSRLCSSTYEQRSARERKIRCAAAAYLRPRRRRARVLEIGTSVRCDDPSGGVTTPS